MRRVGCGDETAFAELYDQLSPLVYGIVLRVVRDPDQAQEVTQEVMVELWQLAPRFDRGKGTVKAWATTVAHRRAVDRVRSEQSVRNRVQRLRTLAEQHGDDTERVLDRAEEAWDRARVRRALATLTAPQRQAIELAYFGGHTYREVAALLGEPEGTVKSRIRDGMSRLRDELGTL